jgi:NADH:ubiquinone oxidoreductase subunit D
MMEQEHSYALAIEQLAEQTIPIRAQLIRTIFA